MITKTLLHSRTISPHLKTITHLSITFRAIQSRSMSSLSEVSGKAAGAFEQTKAAWDFISFVNDSPTRAIFAAAIEEYILILTSIPCRQICSKTPHESWVQGNQGTVWRREDRTRVGTDDYTNVRREIHGLRHVNQVENTISLATGPRSWPLRAERSGRYEIAISRAKEQQTKSSHSEETQSPWLAHIQTRHVSASNLSVRNKARDFSKWE